METYNLKLEGTLREGLANDISDQLARLFALLCVIYEGRVVIPPDSYTKTTYKRSCVDMVDRNHLLEKEVSELKKLFSAQGVSFELEPAQTP